MAAAVNAIRAERPDRTLLLDGGDTWQGDYISLKSRGGSMVAAMNALGVDAMTAHWEFTYGADRVTDIAESELKFPFLAGNVRDTEWNEGVFDSTHHFERGGFHEHRRVGQAFPFTPIAQSAPLMEKRSLASANRMCAGVARREKATLLR